MLSRDIFDLPKLKQQLESLESVTHSPDFWSDPDKAQRHMREISALKARIDPVEKLKKTLSDIEELRLLLEETDDSETEVEIEEMTKTLVENIRQLEITTLLGGEHDANPAIVEIQAGAGGTEACDWARMLARMYMRWAEKKGFDVEVLNETPGEVTGYRSITLLFNGAFAYGLLRAEHGVHRLVRISPFDANSRRHTSFALVDVTPEVQETEVSIDPEDLKVEVFRASGAGGQHVNKTESAVRITHIPTGIVVNCQSERSQIKNRATAMKILASRLFDLERAKSEDRLRQLRGELTSADWGKQIRSYVMQPYTMVKDNRTNYQSGNVIGVLDGEIDEFIEAFLRMPAA
jgi:peptide chain release factor 2